MTKNSLLRRENYEHKHINKQIPPRVLSAGVSPFNSILGASRIGSCERDSGSPIAECVMEYDSGDGGFNSRLSKENVRLRYYAFAPEVFWVELRGHENQKVQRIQCRD